MILDHIFRSLLPGAATGMIIGGAMLVGSQACKPPPPQTGADALALAKCVATEFANGDSDPVTVGARCQTQEIAVVSDILKMLDKKVSAACAPCSSCDGGVHK